LLTFQEADEVRKDEAQDDVYIYYHRVNKHWICSVARHLNGDGFLVTAYLTSKSKKKGKLVWQKK